jgi:D-alanyl-D-alanine carboxypeptidase/D-alanyl-D-alanine-endopeptidase (penicillin-binding protein 4)
MPRSALTLRVDRKADAAAETVTVAGNVPAGAERLTFYRSVAQPERYAAAVLRMQLAAVGIEVGPATTFAAAPPATAPLLEFDGPPLSEIVRRCLKYSNNLIAESLVKLLGAEASGEPGSWANGVPALRAALAELGVAGDGLVVVDGSGLSYDDRVSPRQLVRALRAADASFPLAAEFTAALPIAARDGTLEKRADGAVDAVRAKTGLLTRITGLSGFARLADGNEVVFSLLVNSYRSSDDRAMAAVDGFVAALAKGAVGPRAPASATSGVGARGESP